MKAEIIVICLALFILACEQDEIITRSPDAKLTVSTDTVLFDTLLTERLSLTKRFRIFNLSENAVNIGSIHLGLENNSNYRIFVNGKEGPDVKDETLAGGDSLLVLVDAMIDPKDKDLPYLVKDSVVIEWNTNIMDVKLVAWGQDANYITQQSVCDVTWESSRPYVIYDSLFIPPDCQLTIHKGVRLLFNKNAALHIAGTLIVEGDSASRVVFRNIRYDFPYIEAPGQWGDPRIGAGIVFYPQSRNNQIRYAIIENANTGIYVGIPDDNDEFDLILKNTIIRHMSRYGILAFTSDIYTENTLAFNCGISVLANLAGGTYHYQHCTFSNTPNFFGGTESVVQFTDNVSVGEEPIVEELNVKLLNNIIWGSNKKELVINGGGGAEINVELISNLIRYDEGIPDNYTSSKDNFPGFVDPASFDFTLDSLAFPIDKGSTTNTQIDLTGKLRNAKPDIGAFEYYP